MFLNKLSGEGLFDERVATNPGFKKEVDEGKVNKAGFRRYYGLRASVAFSKGSHDEWNIVRMINQKRREADSNLGWAHVHVNGASGGKQLMPDDDRDLCEICWSPLQTLMKKVHDEAREKRNSAASAASSGR